MIFSFDLLINAIVSGILIGGFYAAVTSGVSLSFGILDIVNIAHPAFIILGSYVAYIVNATLGSIRSSPHPHDAGVLRARRRHLSDLLRVVRKRGQESLRGLAFFFGLLFITEVSWCSISASITATSRRPISVRLGISA